jgi:hypothetical protein
MLAEKAAEAVPVPGSPFRRVLVCLRGVARQCRLTWRDRDLVAEGFSFGRTTSAFGILPDLAGGFDPGTQPDSRGVPGNRASCA